MPSRFLELLQLFRAGLLHSQHAEIMGLNSHTATEIMTPAHSVHVDDLILVSGSEFSCRKAACVLARKAGEMYRVTTLMRNYVAPRACGHSSHSAALVSDDITASSPSAVH